MCSREPAGAPDKVMTSRALGTVMFSEVYHKGACTHLAGAVNRAVPPVLRHRAQTLGAQEWPDQAGLLFFDLLLMSSRCASSTRFQQHTYLHANIIKNIEQLSGAVCDPAHRLHWEVLNEEVLFDLLYWKFFYYSSQNNAKFALLLRTPCMIDNLNLREKGG
ncbi:hypothetical protein EVAR_14236_1 [Eumeta japonica]|uniref:Uncharacterized protein n=1 Tax=Eumeta variegata TaxID=151549 RepID=A0A4C1WC49_EUMVA|nr:hypothetical protein EVAR_14236_1 [Eumeta japonica]